MPERVTKEEKMIELAILKAKEVLAEFSDGTTVANEQDVMGEEVKLKSPPKNPKEEKIANPTGEEGYGYVGKSVIMLKRLLTVAKGLDLVRNLEMDSIAKGELEDLDAQFMEAFERFNSSPKKDSDFARYEKEYSELKALVKKLGLEGTTYMDAEHGGRANMERKYGFNLHE